MGYVAPLSIEIHPQRQGVRSIDQIGLLFLPGGGSRFVKPFGKASFVKKSLC